VLRVDGRPSNPLFASAKRGAFFREEKERRYEETVNSAPHIK